MLPAALNCQLATLDLLIVCPVCRVPALLPLLRCGGPAEARPPHLLLRRLSPLPGAWAPAAGCRQRLCRWLHCLVLCAQHPRHAGAERQAGRQVDGSRPRRGQAAGAQAGHGGPAGTGAEATVTTATTCCAPPPVVDHHLLCTLAEHHASCRALSFLHLASTPTPSHFCMTRSARCPTSTWCACTPPMSCTLCTVWVSDMNSWELPQLNSQQPFTTSPWK